jgi:spermidine dehydrogenase
MKKDLSSDRTLGMDRPITRRDFLNGVAVGTAALASASLLADTPAAAPGAATAAASGTAAPAPAGAAAQDIPGYYPPLLTGMRGSAPGSFESAHALRDGKTPPAATDTGEQYDLIVVGAGISGLAAAHFYREHAGRASRILILDNHDDFGGHARRNEFDLDGHLHLLNGGTLEIDSPRPYGKVADGLLRTLGIDVEKLIKTTQHLHFYEHLGLKQGTFFDRETFGADKLVLGMGGYRSDKSALAQAVSQAPLSDRARADIVRLETASIDYMPGIASAEKKQRLSRMSYEAFLRDVVKVDPAAIAYYHAITMGEWGVGTDAVSALDCWGFDMPGFQGLKLAKGSIARMGTTPAGYEDTGGSYRLHFPDGNATIARLLVRDLIPQAVGGRVKAVNGAEEIVTARIDYSQLDRAGAPLRLRLGSTVVRARHLGDPGSAPEVEVTYVRGGGSFTARARGVVLACYNMMIPYLCPELPAAQKEALHSLVKTPLVRRAETIRRLFPWRLPLVFSLESPRHHRLVSEHPIARGAHSGTHGAHALQAGTSRARSESRGPRRAARHVLRDLRAQHPRPARPHPQGRRIRSGARHHGDHREPMASRLCTRVQPAVRARASRGPSPARARSRAVRQDNDCQLGLRRRGIHRFGHRAGTSSRHGAVEELSARNEPAASDAPTASDAL